MAFPTVASVTPSTTGFDSSPAFSLPATVDSGDLLILAAAGHPSSGTITDPTGWTRLQAAVAASGFVGVWYRIADGTEGGGTVEPSFQFNCDVTAGQVYRITGWHGTSPPEMDALNSQASTAVDDPDPTGITASWGSADNLFIVVLGTADDPSSVSAWPTNYGTNTTTTESGSTTNASTRLHTSWRNLAAASDDPGVFTLSEVEACHSGTLVVRPSAGGGGGISIPVVMHHRRQIGVS